MNTAPSLQRQSFMDHGATAAAAPTAPVTTSSNIHTSSRSAFIVTSAAHSASNSVIAPNIVFKTPCENTYRTEPNKPFSVTSAKTVLRDVMEDMLEGQRYDKEACKHLATSLADAIKMRVKELGHPRYKLVTNVVIGQAEDASIAFASRCVWNENFDSFAEYTYRNGSLYAVGLVHAFYCD